MVGISQHGNQQTLEIGSVFPGELVVKYLPAKKLVILAKGNNNCLYLEKLKRLSEQSTVSGLL